MRSSILSLGGAVLLAQITAAQEPGSAGALQIRPDKSFVPEEPVVIPMGMRGVQPTVEVLINGEGPFVFAIDTGGQGSARVDVSLVEELGLEPVGEMLGGDPTGRQGAPMKVFELEYIQVGDAMFDGVRAASRDYNSAARRAGLGKIHGILGYHLFADHVLTLDYPGKSIRIERGPLEAPPGAKLLEITTDPDYVPAVRAKIGEIEIDELMIDTGKMGGISVPKSIVEAMTFLSEPTVAGRGRTVTGEIEILRARVDGELSFGGIRLEDPWLEFADILPVSIVGSAFLKDYRLTTDPKQGVVWLRTPEEEAALRRSRTAMAELLDTLDGELAVEGTERVGEKDIAVGGKTRWSRAYGGRYLQERFELQVGARTVRGESFLGQNQLTGNWDLVQIDDAGMAMRWLSGGWDGETSGLRFESVPRPTPEGPEVDPALVHVIRLEGQALVRETWRADENGTPRLTSRRVYTPSASSESGSGK